MISKSCRTPACTLVATAFLLGCPSKEGERQDAAKPQTPPAQGPLANLESLNPVTEAWAIDGAPAPMIFYAEHDLRVSATCQKAPGQIACDAVRFLRNGMPVEIARRFLDGRQSAGVKACMRMNQPVVVARNAVGSEDSFCRFPDGSMASNGAIERYGMRVIE
jgi:hypothetical protein